MFKGVICFCIKNDWTFNYLFDLWYNIYEFYYCRSATVAGENGLFAGVQLRHAALERNKRCLLAYL